MGQKNNIESYYSVEGLCIKVIHHDDALFNLIDDELKYYKSKEKDNPNGVAALIPSDLREIFVPDKAVRSTIEEDKKEIYTHDNKGYIMLKNNYVIELDLLNKKVQIKYYGDGVEAYPILRGFIKGLFVNAAEDEGFLYMHAAAVNYNGKIIVLAGDSHCGKSSFLLRFIQKGAKIISDDSLLIKDKKIIPFTFKSNVDENLAKRFGIKNEFFDNGKYIETNKNYKNTDFIFFLHIWNNDRSEIKPFEYSKALFNLVQRYRIKEMFLRRSKGFLFKNYSDFLGGAKCFEFYAGNNEEEVRKTLFEFLNEN